MWGTVEIICDVCQDQIETGRVAYPVGQSFLQLSEKVIDEAMQVVPVIAVSVDGCSNIFQDRNMPIRDSG